MPPPDTTETDALDGHIEPVCREGDGGAFEDVFGDPHAFSDTLKSISTAAGDTASACLQEFDGHFGAPVIDYSSAACFEPTVIATEEKDGRPVREDMSSGPDVVIAYDDQGNAHRFPDDPITKLPVDFSGIPDWRAKQLDRGAQELIDKYYANPDDQEMSFRDVANIMKDISQRNDLTEVEKTRMWSGVHHLMGSQDLSIDDSDEKPEMIDSWKGSWDPWHALIGMNDGYHADKLINMSPEDASTAIFEHEDSKEGDDSGFTWKAARFLLGRNEGDINASEGQLKALRQLRDQGTFSAYAAEWERQFVRTDR